MTDQPPPGDERYPVQAGDPPRLPAGHAPLNEGNAERRHLVVGEREPAEAVICRDSGRGVRLPGAGHRRSAAMDCREALEE